MSRILIDITDLESWFGIHGGTQRVAYGIAKQYYLNASTSDESSVQFISFSVQSNAFYKTSFTPIYERTEQQKESTLVSAVASSMGLKTYIKQRVRPYIPENIRKNQFARRVAINGYKSGVGVIKKGKHIVKRYSSKQPKHHQNKPVEFNNNDIVLILGKPWDYPNMEKVLTVEKNKAGFKLIQVVYDLIIPLQPQLHHPTLFKSYTRYIYEAIYASDLLLPISKSTDHDLKIFADDLNLSLPKTKVIRLADEVSSSKTANDIKPDERINKQFIACIGTIEIRKNHMFLYYLYKLAAERGIDLPQLIIIGTRGWLSGDVQYLIEHDPLIKNKILIIDNVNDSGLAWVYKNCLFSIYPSLYEGWGLPVAESLAYGKMCLSSGASSMPEIAGDLINYFSPYSPEECLQKLLEYLDEDYLAKKTIKLKQTYESTSWEDTYHQVKKAIDNFVYSFASKV